MSCEPPTIRECRQRSGSNRLATLPAPATVASGAEEGERCRPASSCSHRPCTTRRRSRASVSSTSALSHCSNVIAVELGGARVLPRRLGIELGAERVELRDGRLVGAAEIGGQRLVVAVVAVELAFRVDVEVIALTVGVEDLDAELREERVHLALVRRDPLAAELVRLAADLDVQQAPTDAIPRLERRRPRGLRRRGRSRRRARRCPRRRRRRRRLDLPCLFPPDRVVRRFCHIMPRQARAASRRRATACRRRPSSSGCGPRRSPRCGSRRSGWTTSHSASVIAAMSFSLTSGRDAVVEQLDADQWHGSAPSARTYRSRSYELSGRDSRRRPGSPRPVT